MVNLLPTQSDRVIPAAPSRMGNVADLAKKFMSSFQSPMGEMYKNPEAQSLLSGKTKFKETSPQTQKQVVDAYGGLAMAGTLASKPIKMHPNDVYDVDRLRDLIQGKKVSPELMRKVEKEANNLVTRYAPDRVKSLLNDPKKALNYLAKKVGGAESQPYSTISPAMKMEMGMTAKLNPRVKLPEFNLPKINMGVK